MKTMTKVAIPQAPDTWRLYKKGLCDDCWAGCCTLPVEARPHDLVRLGLVTQDEIDWSLSDVADQLFKRRIIQHYDPKEGMFTLEQVGGRDCIYLDPRTRRCTVYEKRPDTCRNFPKIGPRPGHCPYKPR
ncbi:MAG: YkgJ family cysteine cluster protein [Deltaproteobacteria bacterium]|nr:YkgJ family cysteine cluster protein [Deltaproteobacteria bacterium]